MIVSGKPPFNLFEDLVEEYIRKLRRLRENSSIRECIDVEIEHLNAVHEVYEDAKASAYPLQYALDRLFVAIKTSDIHEVDMAKFWSSEKMQNVRENIQSRYMDKPEVLHDINEILSTDQKVSYEQIPDMFKKLSVYMENSLDSNLYHELATKMTDQDFKERWLEGRIPAIRILHETKNEIVKENKVFGEIMSKSINELSDTNKHKNGLLSIDHAELAKNHSSLSYEHLQISEEMSNAIKAANTLDKKCKGSLTKTKNWTYDNGIFHFEHMMALGNRSILYDLEQKKIRIEETEVAKTIQQKENEEKAQRNIKLATRSYIDSLIRDYKKDPNDDKKIIPAGSLKQDMENKIERLDKTANVRVVRILNLYKDTLSDDLRKTVEKVIDKIGPDDKGSSNYKNLSTQEIKEVEKCSKYVREAIRLEPNYETLKEKVEPLITATAEKTEAIKNEYEKVINTLNSLLVGTLKMSVDPEVAIEKMCVLDFNNSQAASMAEGWIKNPANAKHIEKLFARMEQMEKSSESNHGLNLSEVFNLKERKLVYKDFAKANKEYQKTISESTKSKEPLERTLEKENV